MDHSERERREEDRIESEAAQWIVKQDHGLTAKEQDEFFEWLAQDPRHGEWLAKQRQTWEEFDLLKQWRPENSAEPNPDLLARIRPKRRLLKISGALATAAVLVFMAALLWKHTGHEETRREAKTIFAQTYERLELEDGSVVELNRGARVSVEYNQDIRRVRLLAGEAHFTVAKNSAWPFIVSSSGTDVQAIGTAFGVRLNRESVEVLVTEGHVKIAQSLPVPEIQKNQGPSPLYTQDLVAGQRTVVSLASAPPPPQVETVSPSEIDRLQSWRLAVLKFDSTPLAEVVEEFNRRNELQIIIADDEINDLAIVATFHPNNVKGFIRLLEVTAGVKVEYRNSAEVVLHKAER